MSFGRIKRKRSVAGGRDRTIAFTATVGRDPYLPGRYRSLACMRKLSRKVRKGWSAKNPRHAERCGAGSGRTPQSAIAKAVKDLAQHIAYRGRKLR